MTRKFADVVVRDLRRQHPWAFERVGFLYCETAHVGDHWTMYPTHYDPVAEERYLHDESVGAAIDGAAVRRAIQRALDTRLGTLHVHLHSSLVPDFGKLDLDEQERLIPSFIAVNRAVPHGALVLFDSGARARIWCPGTRGSQRASRVAVVGTPTQLSWEAP